MLCVRVSCEDEGKHIQISCVCEDLCLVSCERTGYAEIWSDVIRDVNASCEDVSDHIRVCSEFVPSIDIWCSYVCYIGEWRPYLYINPLKVSFPCNSKTYKTTDIFSNIGWIISEKI